MRRTGKNAVAGNVYVRTVFSWLVLLSFLDGVLKLSKYFSLSFRNPQSIKCSFKICVITKNVDDFFFFLIADIRH